MEDRFYEINLYDSLANQWPVFGFLLLGLIGATIMLTWKRASRARISVSLGVIGIAVFFYAGALEALGLAYDHEENMRLGIRDPQALDKPFAEFYIRLWAFRSLSVFALTVSAIGLATSKPERANMTADSTAYSRESP